MIIGYARVSTTDQKLDLQMDAIKKYAEERGEEYEIFSEKESGGKADREQLTMALKMARAGDIFITYKLDRVARSTKQLQDISEQLKKKGVQFVSITDNIDTTTAMGQAMFGMIAVFAEFERNLIVERTKAGLEAAKRKGKTGGKAALSTKVKKSIIELYNGGNSAADIAKEHGIGRSTVYKVLKESKE